MAGCHGLVLRLALLTLGQTPPALPSAHYPTPISDSWQVQLPSLAPPAVELPAPEASIIEPATDASGRPRRFRWPEVWGFAQSSLFLAGTRMAPNGFDYQPLFDLDIQLNVGLLPNKQLYLFVDSDFWGQKATTGQTHGPFDYTKREFDVTAGVAWNYLGPLELRFFGYAYNSLNRGKSLLVPYGYADGLGFENRYYFASKDPYDVGRLSFLSFGYIPSKMLMGADGVGFKPGFFARAYLTHDLGLWNAYAFVDSDLVCKDGFSPRLLLLDAGLAARPFAVLEGLELRIGGMDTFDVLVIRNRGLGYFAIRFLW
jgi:hypothetical protein